MVRPTLLFLPLIAGTATDYWRNPGYNFTRTAVLAVLAFIFGVIFFKVCVCAAGCGDVGCGVSDCLACMPMLPPLAIVSASFWRDFRSTRPTSAACSPRSR